ncbi:MAG TPA: TauD/TfdA family dioxygenase [Steroidobacteraceae bacterium]|jgi:gamma-butyrobetaine dioxygenase|nr:TauD/TfdA family dioxygenase [Steroidobacteraceae bacterium]
MSAAPSIKRLWSSPDMLGVEWSDGSSSEFASLWLRDNLREDRDPHSGQRLVDIADLPADPRIKSARSENGGVTLAWEAEPGSATFEAGWLRQHAADRPAEQSIAPRLWLEGAGLDAARDFAWTTYAEAQQDRVARARWLGRLLRDGVAFMRQVPCVDPGILDAAALVGRVSETNYGRVYDVRSVPQPENLAYSDLGLGLHTDNPYREPVPGFQVLHALIASPDGGDSLFGDGFALAEHLRRTAPEAFQRLSDTPVPFHYRSKDADLYAERPLLQLTCGGELRAVHYNSRSVAPLRLDAQAARPFYKAYRQFAALLRDARFHLKLRLNDGDLVVFDNQRTLHGRTPFSSARYPRHLRGCYLTRDSVYSEAALLARETP